MGLTPMVGVAAACRATGRPRASHYRHHRSSPPPPRPVPGPPRPQPRALAAAERQALLDVLHSERFVDQAPAEGYATLLDEGSYLASIATMYRVLRAAGEVAERRRQATHPPTVKPELVAAAPNRVWSGISPNCSARPNGPTTTCMWSSTSSAAMCPAGWSPNENPQHLPSGCWTRPSPNSTSPVTSWPSTPTAGPRWPPSRSPSSWPTSASPSRTPARTSATTTLQREPVQDPQVPPHLPRPIRFDPGRPRLLPAVLRLVQRRPPSFGHRAAGPRRCPLRPRRAVRAARAEVLTAAYAAHPERFVRKPPQPPALPAVAWINQPDTQEAAQ